MKVATSANSVTERHTFFSLFIIPFEFNASIKKKIILCTPMKTTSATMLVYSTVLANKHHRLRDSRLSFVQWLFPYQ